MNKVLTKVLICLLMSVISGCAAVPTRSSEVVCFPPFDRKDPALKHLITLIWGMVVGIVKMCGRE
jgi:hypothetical protein